METVRSVCPYDCPDACGLLIYKEDGKVVKVVGDPDHSFTRGTLCPKMAHYERTIYSPRRLTTPLRRFGTKGSGIFEPISWEEALQTIGDRWRHIISRYGAEAILPYSYAGTMGIIQKECGKSFFYSLGASQLERTICASAKGYAQESLMGKTLGINPVELQKSDVVILWSISMLATDIHLLHDINAAKAKGTVVWVIDTYQTATAAIADKVVCVRPGTDGALALGMMHIMARDGLIDRTFIREHVQGYDQLAAEVLPQYTPEKASELSGVPVNAIEELARCYATAKAPFIRLGSGLSRYGNGAMTVRLVCCLPAVVGAWSKPGGGLLGSASTGAVYDMLRIVREDFRKETRTVNMNQIGEALNELRDPPIMSLYVYSSNPAGTAPDQNRVIAGLEREDLFTVVHERFLTDTAKYADIVLPATTSVEHSDLYRAYGHYVLQRGSKIIEAVGQSKSNWDVFCLLAESMGITDPYYRQKEEDLIEELLAHPTPQLAKVDLKRLAAGEPVDLPLEENYKMDFRTPSGKIELYNSKEEPPLPNYKPPYGGPEAFWLINAPDPRILDSSFNERAELTDRNIMVLQMNPNDAKTGGFCDGQAVVAQNDRGKASFTLKISDKVPLAVVVTEGVWWMEHVKGQRSVNALTSQRFADKGHGSTFYDVKVNVTAQ